ncbi:hypothetical protein CCACVL1_09979 [Corchorus capsularis]|uniref:Uncharacterized protein n=1 Tax=Corchorus capsularis TaxID=210143 RepID=A0A1R3ITC7_COCAP|nr:hypothetical protein CCACVL1_09979 [Corchorus capsularis]
MAHGFERFRVVERGMNGPIL